MSTNSCRMPWPEREFEAPVLLLRAQRCLEPGCYPRQPDVRPQPVEAGLDRGLDLPRLLAQPALPQDHSAPVGRAGRHPGPHLCHQPGPADHSPGAQAAHPCLPPLHGFAPGAGRCCPGPGPAGCCPPAVHCPAATAGLRAVSHRLRHR